MAFQIEGDAVFLAGVEDRSETLDQKLETYLANVGNLVLAKTARQRRKEEEMTPAVSR